MIQKDVKLLIDAGAQYEYGVRAGSLPRFTWRSGTPPLPHEPTTAELALKSRPRPNKFSATRPRPLIRNQQREMTPRRKRPIRQVGLSKITGRERLGNRCEYQDHSLMFDILIISLKLDRQVETASSFAKDLKRPRSRRPCPGFYSVLSDKTRYYSLLFAIIR
jgi:hypothetical protein